MRRLVSTTILLALAGCAKQSSPALPPQASVRYAKLGIPTKDGQPDLTDVSVSLARTACLGSCPVYEVTLYGNGSGVYDGRQFVKTTGRWEFEVEPHHLAEILEELATIDFMQNEHRCRWLANDAPAIDLRLRIGTREQRFYGMNPATPDEPEEAAIHSKVDLVASHVETAANIESWIGTKSERNALNEAEQARARERSRK
jgi:hypothetical protein